MVPLSRNLASRMEKKKYDGGLPDPGAQPVEQEVAYNDAERTAQTDLDHATQAWIAGEPQRNQG